MIEAHLHAAMQAVHGPLNWLPKADGQIHRYYVPGDRAGTRNGAYALYSDGIASGWFGSFKETGGTTWHTWSSRNPSTPFELESIRRRVEQARRQREAEQLHRQQLAAVKSMRLYVLAVPAKASHPYLVNKGCQPHNLRQLESTLLVPLYHECKLVNLQRICPDGTKRFMFGGRVAGAHSPMGKVEPGKLIYVCEGWATGATIHEHTDAAVACAMNAGNLLAVGQQLRRIHPNSPLVIAGDDDRQTKGNPGRTFAERAAEQLGCGVVFPPWSGAEPLSLSDFNDLKNWQEGY